jgi:predicted cupin superfamily sugar epimerase
MAETALSADAIIALLDLKPHPEGGFYRETFRDEQADGGRAASTLIYFLLKRGERSHWHRVDAVEVWHYYAGAPLALHLAANDAGPVTTLVVGADLARGERPQGVVPTNHWQAAESLGDWTLVGCTVAPGFDFAGFVLAPKGWSPGGAAP